MLQAYSPPNPPSYNTANRNPSRSPAAFPDDSDHKWYSTFNLKNCLWGGKWLGHSCDPLPSPAAPGTEGDLGACLFGGDKDTCDFISPVVPEGTEADMSACFYGGDEDTCDFTRPLDPHGTEKR